MTYVIITTTPEMASTVNPGQPWPRSVSRRAVATLEEDFEATLVGHGASGDWALAAKRKVSESGGSVGPLPDGTLIEVELIAAKS